MFLFQGHYFYNLCGKGLTLYHTITLFGDSLGKKIVGKEENIGDQCLLPFQRQISQFGQIGFIVYELMLNPLPHNATF